MLTFRAKLKMRSSADGSSRLVALLRPLLIFNTTKQRQLVNLHQMIGLGVAGNFTGHLEQAGESDDFVGLVIDDPHAPKGLFPFYLPKESNDALCVFPLSSGLLLPPNEKECIQIEPEVALLCDIIYDDKNNIADLIPHHFAAFNDCSIRKPNAKKISEKKNWGEASKGVSKQFIPIDTLQKGGVLDGYSIASFLKRDENVCAYGINSSVAGYSYFHDKLLAWIIHKLNTQIDEGPLENIKEHLRECRHPTQALISIGATRYTPFGECTYLIEGDELFVILYPHQNYSIEDIEQMVVNSSFDREDISALHQIVQKR